MQSQNPRVCSNPEPVTSRSPPPPRRLAALSDLSAVRPLASGRDSWPRVETVESTTVLGDGGTDPTPPARKREESGLDVG